MEAALPAPSEQQRCTLRRATMQPRPSGATTNEAPRETKPPGRPLRTLHCSRSNLTMNGAAIRRGNRHDTTPNAPTQRPNADGELQDCDVASDSYSRYSPTPPLRCARFARHLQRFVGQCLECQAQHTRRLRYTATPKRSALVVLRQATCSFWPGISYRCLKNNVNPYTAAAKAAVANRTTSPFSPKASTNGRLTQPQRPDGDGGDESK
jgi:hypothetical protein